MTHLSNREQSYHIWQKVAKFRQKPSKKAIPGHALDEEAFKLRVKSKNVTARAKDLSLNCPRIKMCIFLAKSTAN